MAGSVVALNTSSHSSACAAGQDGSGGVIQYQDGASGSAGALVEIIAIAQRRDSGDSPTRHTPSFTGIRSRSRVKSMARAVQSRAAVITPALSGWSFTSSRATSSAGRLASTAAHDSVSRSVSRSRSASARSASLPRSTSVASAVPSSAVSAADPSAASGEPDDAASDTCATSRACAVSAASRAPGSASAGDARGQSLDAAEQRFGDRRAQLVERRDRRVDHPGPGRQVRGAGRVPFGSGRVVLVVAGQVQLAQVEQRVAPVQLQVGEHHPAIILGRAQVRLVVRVGLRGAGLPRRLQLGEPRRHPGRGQVLRDAVVFVPAAVLARLGDVQVADRAHPWIEVAHG